MRKTSEAVRLRYVFPKGADVDRDVFVEWVNRLDRWAVDKLAPSTRDLWMGLGHFGSPVRALSIKQPWARLLTEAPVGADVPAKTIEFRSTPTPHRDGVLPIALHSSLHPVKGWQDLVSRYRLDRIVRPYGTKPGGGLCPPVANATLEALDPIPSPDPGDLGRIVGVALLGPSTKLEGDADSPRLKDHPGYPAGYPVDFSEPRYGWPIRAAVRLERSIPVVGRLGLWDINGQDPRVYSALCEYLAAGQFEVPA